MAAWYGSDGWSPARKARLRLLITMICVIAVAVAISLAMFRSFLLPIDSDARLEEYMRQQDERRLRGDRPADVPLPGPEPRQAPGGP